MGMDLRDYVSMHMHFHTDSMARDARMFYCSGHNRAIDPMRAPNGGSKIIEALEAHKSPLLVEK